MLKLQLRFENLEDILERFQNQIMQNSYELREIQTTLLGKSSQKQLGAYFERISQGIHKEVGDKQHKYRLDDPNFLNDEV